MQFQHQLSSSLQKLLQSPQQLNQISKQTLYALSKLHSSYNKQLPPSLISHMIQQLKQTKLLQNRKSSLKFSFYMNIIRHIVLINFHELKDNKIFLVLSMIFAQKHSEFYHQLQKQDKSIVILKYVAQIAVANQIILKFVQKSKVFIPEYFKSLNLIITKLIYSITRNIKHVKKVLDVKEYSTLDCVLNVAFGKDTDKEALIFYLFGLLNFVMRQAASYISSNANKKQVLKLNPIMEVISKVQELQQNLPQQLVNELQVPAELKKYQNEQNDDQQNLQNQNNPVFLQQLIKVKQLTPRFYNEQQQTINKVLRKKKNKLQKKMQLQIRQNTHQKLQQRRVIQDVKKAKTQGLVKKELFVMQKQTQQAKKHHKQMKKVKNIKKDSKLGRKGKK